VIAGEIAEVALNLIWMLIQLDKIGAVRTSVTDKRPEVHFGRWGRQIFSGRVGSVRTPQMLRSLVPCLAIPHVSNSLGCNTVPLRDFHGALLMICPVLWQAFVDFDCKFG